MTMSETGTFEGIFLKPCPLCDSPARMVHKDDMHLSFAVYDQDEEVGETVEHNFLHYGGVMCTSCCLILPIFSNEPAELVDTVQAWNERFLPAETDEKATVQP